MRDSSSRMSTSSIRPYESKDDRGVTGLEASDQTAMQHDHVADAGSSEGGTKTEDDDKDDNMEIVDWDGPDDPDNPFNWSIKYKWLVTITTCFISILTGLPAGSYGSGADKMAQTFGISNTNQTPWLNWATTSWNMGAALWPLIFVPLTENTGRMPGYFISYIVFLVFLFPSAWAPSGAGGFACITVTRFFGGGASSVSINIVGGTITDIWKGVKDRSVPMSIFGMTSVVGIALGPFIGGAIQRNLSWRWIFWTQLIFDAGCLPLFWFILRETRGDVILAKRAKKLRKQGRNAYAKSELNKQNVWEMIKVSFKRPTKMLITEFVVISFTIWVSFAWGILFLFQSSITQTFQSAYGFSVFQTSLIQLAISAGAVVATIINPIQDRLYMQSAKRNKESPGTPIPEARLYFSVPGSLLFTAGLFWYGWTLSPDIHWIVPALGIAAVGIGIYSIYLGVVNYLADAYEKYAASALSAASLGRNTFGAFLPLGSPALYNNLGFGWGSTLLGFIAAALSLAPVVLLWKGVQIRARSPFMSQSTYDEGESEKRQQSWSSAAGRQVSRAGRSQGMPGPQGQAAPAAPTV